MKPFEQQPQNLGFNPNIQYSQQGQYAGMPPQQNTVVTYSRPQAFSTQRIPYVDTISYRPPMQAFQANYSVAPQQFAPRAPQQMPQYPAAPIQQPMQRNAPAQFPYQPTYDYLPKQPPIDMGMYQPFAPVAKKKGIFGIALPQVISLGIGFGLFLLGFISLITPPTSV